MHQLDRATVPKPTCLVDPPEEKRYADLRGRDKDEIRESLWALQTDRCAYCERRTARHKDEGHIEHFRKQCDFSHLDLDWDNMFWSCMDTNSCGKHKDDCDMAVSYTHLRAH